MFLLGNVNWLCILKVIESQRKIERNNDDNNNTKYKNNLIRFYTLI